MGFRVNVRVSVSFGIKHCVVNFSGSALNQFVGNLRIILVVSCLKCIMFIVVDVVSTVLQPNPLFPITARPGVAGRVRVLMNVGIEGSQRPLM